MRKWIALLLALITVLTPVTAFADDGSIRHDVHGDVSKFEVSEKLDESEAAPNAETAQIGTDLILFVDPDTASRITFYVTDEQGNPIEGALIFIGYKGDTELYGSTNTEGYFQCYLFRDVEYSYTVYKPGYEIAEGTFTATEATEFIRVVLRKYYKLDVFVVDNGVPVPGITVIIDGVEYTTDENGMVRVYKTNGVYDVEVVTPDGRRIPVKALVNGDTQIFIDIGEDEEGIIPGGLYSDRFLVYNKYYDPEDYVLTKYLFEESHVPAEDAAAYLDATTDTVLIEAQPQREQFDDKPDVDILDENGKPLYTQRSLMPSGFVIRAWENEGFEELVFTNEEMALRFELDQLHNEDMMKLYGVIRYLTEKDVKLEDISTEATLADWQGYKKAGFDRISAWDLELRKLDLNAVKEYCFDFNEREGAEKLEDEMFINSLFEFRLTPITRDALLDMISGGATGDHSMPKNDMLLASWGYYVEELRRWLADGRLSEAEHDELYAVLVDGRLSETELLSLRYKKENKELTDAETEFILNAAADGKMYRVSCWLSCRNVEVEISTLIQGMELIRIADRQYEAIAEEIRAGNPEIEEAELAAAAEARLAADYDFMTVRYDPARYSMDDYKAGEFTSFAQPQLVRALDEENPFHEVISGRYFNRYWVDVRRETIILDGIRKHFAAYITAGDAQLEQSRGLMFPCSDSVLTGLTY